VCRLAVDEYPCIPDEEGHPQWDPASCVQCGVDELPLNKL